MLENELEKIYSLREKQRELKEEGVEEKEIEKIDMQSQRLLNTETKAGTKRLDAVIDDAEKENKFRDAFNDLVGGLRLGVDWEKFKNDMEGDRRYVTMQVDSPEKGEVIKRFLKALKPNFRTKEYKRDQNAFIREMQTMEFLKKNTDLPILDIVRHNDKSGKLLYNLAETLPEAPIGFVHSREDVSNLKDIHAIRSIDQLFRLGDVKLPADIDAKIADLQDPFEHYEGYKENVWNLLDNKEEPEDTEVRALDGEKDENGEVKPEIYLDVLARRFGLSGKEMRKKVEELLERWEDKVTEYDEGDWVLTHGDLSPKNIYADKDDAVQFLDWEWAGKTKNKLLAMVYDFGNMRARAWNNPDFQKALDNEIRLKFKELGDKEAGQAVVSLGTFRSHAMLAGFFENYEPEKQMEPDETERRKKTEEAITLAFAEAGIPFPGIK